MADSVIVFDGVCVLCSRWVGFVALLVSIVPHFIRDPLYRWIARHRYRLFGQRPSCLVPAADIADRFLH